MARPWTGIFCRWLGGRWDKNAINCGQSILSLDLPTVKIVNLCVCFPPCETLKCTQPENGMVLLRSLIEEMT